MNKKIIKILMILCVVGFLLFGCGYEEESSSVQPYGHDAVTPAVPMNGPVQKMMGNWLRDSVREAWEENQQAFTQCAEAALDFVGQEHPWYIFKNKSGRFSDTMDENLEALNQSCGGLFDEVFTDGTPIHPENSCIFRATLWIDDNVYCWIDLVYNENWEQHLEQYREEVESGYLVPLGDNWCIAWIYGY